MTLHLHVSKSNSIPTDVSGKSVLSGVNWSSDILLCCIRICSHSQTHSLLIQELFCNSVMSQATILFRHQCCRVKKNCIWNGAWTCNLLASLMLYQLSYLWNCYGVSQIRVWQKELTTMYSLFLRKVFKAELGTQNNIHKLKVWLTEE